MSKKIIEPDLPCGHSYRFHIFGAKNGCLACQCEELGAEKRQLQARIEMLEELLEYKKIEP